MRAHREQLFGGEGLFADHLARVADAVRGDIAKQAAWLHAVPHLRGRTGVPWRVVRVVEMLRQRPGEYPASRTGATRRSPGS